MKGPSLYKKLKVNRNGYANMPDGKSTSSPFQQDEGKKVKGPLPEGNIKLQPSENPDVALTGGKGAPISEKIADLEDRIEFINEDISNTDKEATPQQKEDLAKLKQELAIIRSKPRK